MRSSKIDLPVGRSEVVGDLVENMNRPAKPCMRLALVTPLESNLAKTVRQPPARLNDPGVVCSPESGGDLRPEFGVVEPMLQDDLSNGTGTLQFDHENPSESSGIGEPAEVRDHRRRLLDLGPEQVHFDLDPR